MRSVEEYVSKAEEFERLAAGSANASLAKRYADVASCFRLLAEERKRLIVEGTIEPATLPVTELP